MTDPETQAIIDIVKPFMNRQKLRNNSKSETREYFYNLLTKLLAEVFDSPKTVSRNCK